MIQSFNEIQSLSLHSIWLQRAVGFYSRKFHFIIIPIGIVGNGIHLKFAITYIGQCPIQPMIIIYMIGHVLIHLLLILFALIGIISIRYNFPHGIKENKSIGILILIIILILQFVILLFSFIWLIIGSVWIFGAKINGVQGDDPNMIDTYCQSDLFKPAFILLIINYIIHCIIIFLIIVRFICCKRKPTNPLNIQMNTLNNTI